MTIEKQAEPNAADADSPNDAGTLRTGIVLALTAQVIWGLFPAFLKLLSPTPAIEIVAHRAIWSFFFLVLLTIASRQVAWSWLPQWSDVRRVLARPRVLVALLGAAFLIFCNWLGFVVAIALDRTMDASIGYYICPQVVVLLGVVFEKENLSVTQWLAFACSSVGVLTMAASAAGAPWLGLVVAFSFGFYALLKKRIPCPALTSLSFETGIIFLPALAFLVCRSCWPSELTPRQEPALLPPVAVAILLVVSGGITIIPLACYVNSVKRIPLTLAGLLQFLGPTMHFLLSVFVFDDPFDRPRVIGIVLVWIGVGLYLRSIRSVNPSRST